MAEKGKHTLTAKEIEGIHKMPTARLIRKLSDIGVTDEQLELMERDDLVRAWTSAVADGRDKPVLKTTGDQPRPIVMDPTSNKRGPCVSGSDCCETQIAHIARNRHQQT